MATLILYATKYGASEKVAIQLSRQLDDAPFYNLREKSLPLLSDFDTIIFGSSIYAGKIRKEAKAFLVKHQAVLMDKKIGFFLSGLSQKEAEQCFKANIPMELLQKAQIKAFLGGIFDPQKANAAERTIMKLVAKQVLFTDTIEEEKIRDFAVQMRIQRNER